MGINLTLQIVKERENEEKKKVTRRKTKKRTK